MLVGMLGEALERSMNSVSLVITPMPWPAVVEGYESHGYVSVRMSCSPGAMFPLIGHGRLRCPATPLESNPAGNVRRPSATAQSRCSGPLLWSVAQARCSGPPPWRRTRVQRVDRGAHHALEQFGARLQVIRMIPEVVVLVGIVPEVVQLRVRRMFVSERDGRARCVDARVATSCAARRAPMVDCARRPLPDDRPREECEREGGE